MTDAPSLVLRRTEVRDLDAILGPEGHPDNSPFVGQWSREKHAATIGRDDHEHWVIARTGGPRPAGYLIAYDLVAQGFGIWIQRMVVAEKSAGIGRAALHAFLADAMPRLGADRAFLDVMLVNERAQRAYRSVGFDDAGLTPGEQSQLIDLVGGLDDGVAIMRVDRGTLRAPAGPTVTIVG